MLIKAYAIHWRVEDAWPPAGRGRRELLGRRGAHRSHLQICNFWRQQGLYILYDGYGPYYVGLVRQGTLGNRLRTHHYVDKHAGKWDRFSWFGFCAVLGARDERGIQKLKLRAELATGRLDDAIADIEALLIDALGPKANRHIERFRAGVEWTQVRADERQDLLEKLR
jgi:hypothetical protein